MKDEEIEAVYEGGVFRPVGPVALPEQTRVVIRPVVVDESKDPQAAKQAMFASLGRSYDTGQADLAERHNDHQP